MNSPTCYNYHARRRAARLERAAAMAADAERARLELAEEHARRAWGDFRDRLVATPPAGWVGVLAAAYDGPERALRDLVREAPPLRPEVGRDLLSWWLHAPTRAARRWLDALAERLLGVPVGVDA